MPITRKTIGTGMTERVAAQVSGPWGKEEIAEAKRIFETAGQHSTFERIATSWEVLCQRLLEKAKLPPWDKRVRICSDGSWRDDLSEDQPLCPEESSGCAIHLIELRDKIDSKEWYAAEILQKIDTVRKALASDDRAWAVHEALRLGMQMATATLKFTWEKAAMSGKTMQRVWDTRTEKSVQSRQKAQQERRAVVRTAAEERWENPQNPCRISDVIHFLKRTRSEEFSKVSPSTLRRDLSKPELWSPAWVRRTQKS